MYEYDHEIDVMLLQFPLATIMVVDDHGNGVPVAWSLQSNEQEMTIESNMTAWKAKMDALDPLFLPSCFIVDDAGAMINVIRCGKFLPLTCFYLLDDENLHFYLSVFRKLWPGVQIFLCCWHVKRCDWCMAPPFTCCLCHCSFPPPLDLSELGLAISSRRWAILSSVEPCSSTSQL